MEKQYSDAVEQQHIPRRLASFGGGVLIAHAALITRPHETIALTGVSGVGKSTLSAALSGFGWTLLGDDTMAASVSEGHVAAQALFPRLRLKPDAVSAINVGGASYIGPDSLGKLVFHLPECQNTRPLDAIFVLEDASEGTVSTNQLRPADACLAIVANSFAHDPNDLEEASRRFGLAADLARRVPVYRLSYPRDFDLIARVAAAINDTLGGVTKAEEA